VVKDEENMVWGFSTVLAQLRRVSERVAIYCVRSETTRIEAFSSRIFYAKTEILLIQKIM